MFLHNVRSIETFRNQYIGPRFHIGSHYLPTARIDGPIDAFHLQWTSSCGKLCFARRYFYGFGWVGFGWVI